MQTYPRTHSPIFFSPQKFCQKFPPWQDLPKISHLQDGAKIFLYGDWVETSSKGGVTPYEEIDGSGMDVALGVHQDG